MRRLVIVLLLLIAASAEARSMFRGGALSPGGAQSIVSITPTTGSFTAGPGSANAPIQTEVVTMSPTFPAFVGTCAISGGSSAQFAINATTCALSVGASDITSTGPYTFNVVATQAGATGSPFTQSVTITGTAPQTIASIMPTAVTFVVGVAGVMGTEVATLSPASPAFSGTWSIVTTGSDHASTPCVNYSGAFTINSSTGALSNVSGSAGANGGICVKATPTNGAIAPFTQAVTATGSSASITSVSLSNLTCTAPCAASSTIGTFSATVSVGSFGGTFPLATSGSVGGTPCTGTNGAQNGNFSVSGSTLSVGGTPLAAGSYLICDNATSGSFSNSPFGQPFTISAVAAGGAITSFTFQNTDLSNPIVPGATGYPIIFGQGWARGDLPTSGSPLHPICQDHANGATLQCQWDDIATHTENGDDGSWRHATFTVLLPATSPQYTSGGIPACTTAPCPGTFQVDFVAASGAYSPVVHGSISDVCTGHDIILKMTDVRNQDDTLRGPVGHTGTLVFDTCVALSNTGRDAPRQTAQGQVRNEWLIQGPPLYSDGSADPLLYVKCYMGQTYNLSGGLGPLNHKCSVHNSWMNVAESSSGNSGAPGPNGFTSDPQAVSYRPVLYDGSTAILDWGTTYFDETVPDTALTISTGNLGVWNIPALGTSMPSVSPKAWGRGMAFRYTDSATPPTATQNGGTVFAQNQLIYACATVTACGFNLVPLPIRYDPSQQMFSKYPQSGSAGAEPLPIFTAIGTGNSTFSYRIQHYHWQAWWTLDPTGSDNWSPPASATRYVEPVAPLLTTAEKTYWEVSGTVPPLQTQNPDNFNPFPPNGNQDNSRYAPLDLVSFGLGTGVGGRPDIGLQNEYVSEAWSAQTPAYWQFIKALSLVGEAQPQGDLLNEATGRLPVINNGQAGSNHAGNGTPFTGLGANFPNTFLFWNGNWPVGLVGLVPPLENVPYHDCTVTNLCVIGWADGYYWGVQDNSHQSAFAFGPYQLFGGEMYLDALQQAGERAIYYAGGACGFAYTGTGAPVNPFSGSAQACTFGGITYYGLVAPGDERRGSAWALRDLIAAASFGADSLPERTYFNAEAAENYWYNVASASWNGLVDPPSPTSGTTNGGQILYNQNAGTDSFGNASSTFIDAYLSWSSYMGWALQHYPLARDYLAQQYRTDALQCGDGLTTPPIANSPSSMLCAVYYYVNPSLATMTPSITWNLTDGANYGNDSNQGNTSTFTSGSSVIQNSMPSFLLSQSWTTKIKFFDFNGFPGLAGCSHLPDQITDGTWYYLVNNTATPGSFEIATTPGGTPLGPFTSSSVPYAGTPCNALMRWDATTAAAGPTAGQFFVSPGYSPYVLTAVTGFVDINSSMGGILSSASVVRNNIITRFNDNTQGWTLQNAVSGDIVANALWDPTISVK